MEERRSFLVPQDVFCLFQDFKLLFFSLAALVVFSYFLCITFCIFGSNSFRLLFWCSMVASSMDLCLSGNREIKYENMTIILQQSVLHRGCLPQADVHLYMTPLTCRHNTSDCLGLDLVVSVDSASLYLQLDLSSQSLTPSLRQIVIVLVKKKLLTYLLPRRRLRIVYGGADTVMSLQRVTRQPTVSHRKSK